MLASPAPACVGAGGGGTRSPERLWKAVTVMSSESAMEYAQGLAESLRSESVDDIGEYLESVLDYQYTRSASGDLVSVRLLVAFGGPNAWVTFDGEGALVEASWWSEVQRVYVPGAPMSGPVLDCFAECVLPA